MAALIVSKEPQLRPRGHDHPDVPAKVGAALPSGRDIAVSTAATRNRTHRRLESAAGTWPIGDQIAASAVLIGAFAAQLVNRSLLDMSQGYVSLFRARSHFRRL